MRSMMFSLIPDRQKPRFAKNEALEGGSKVDCSNPVGRHNTLCNIHKQDCLAIFQPLQTLAVGQMPTRQSGLWRWASNQRHSFTCFANNVERGQSEVNAGGG